MTLDVLIEKIENNDLDGAMKMLRNKFPEPNRDSFPAKDRFDVYNIPESLYYPPLSYLDAEKTKEQLKKEYIKKVMLYIWKDAVFLRYCEERGLDDMEEMVKRLKHHHDLADKKSIEEKEKNDRIQEK